MDPRLADLLAAHDVLGEPMVILDDGGRELGRNASAVRLFARCHVPAQCLVPPADSAPPEVTELRVTDGEAIRVYACSFLRCPEGIHWLWRASDVTMWARQEREASSQALAASEARLRGVLESGFDALVIVQAVRDAEGRIEDFTIVDANQRARDLADASQQSLLGASLFTRFPRSFGHGLWEQCCRVIVTQAPLEARQQAPLDSRPDQWWQRQLVPVGRDLVAISVRDVTAGQVERLALESSEARHRRLFESSGALQLLIDVRTGAIVDANQAASTFYGWSRDTLRGMLLQDIDTQICEAWCEEVARLPDGPGRRMHRVHRLATGEERHVELFIGVAEAEPRHTLHLIVSDITDRMQAEQELRDSEARFRAVISSMRDGVVLVGADGQIRLANTSAGRILGLPIDRIEQHTFNGHLWHSVHEDGRHWPVEHWPAPEALRTGLSQPRQVMGLTDPRGATMWISITADPLMAPGASQPYGAVAVFTDVTAERELTERNRQAQKLDAVSQLAGGIAHDFNNLLTVIRGATVFLRDGIGAASPHLEDVAAIERAADRAEVLTRRLLAVGRRQLLHSEPVDLNALLQELFVAVRAQLPASVEVRINVLTTPVTAAIDRTRLSDAVRALVDNAVAAMPTGGVLALGTSTTVAVSPHDPPDSAPQPYAVLSVTDTGMGMHPEIRARLFEPFFSTAPFGANRGMGLASVHGMVRQSRGFLECDSAPNKGTAIRLFFPMAEEAGATLANQETPRTTTSASEAGVLLVDDDAMLRDLCRRMLERLGRRVYTVASAPEALAFLGAQADAVSLMVTDLTMPGMSGLDLIDAVAAQHPALPMAAISGYVVNGDARTRLDARNVPFLAKPFSVAELERLIVHRGV